MWIWIKTGPPPAEEQVVNLNHVADVIFKGGKMWVFTSSDRFYITQDPEIIRRVREYLAENMLR